MFWRNWPYWIKGGAIGIIFLLTVQLVGTIIFFMSGCEGMGISGCIIRQAFSILPATLLGALFTIAGAKYFLTILPSSITAIILYSVYPLMGALIGWIYGKMKKR